MLKTPAKMALTDSEAINAVNLRNAKLFKARFINALKNAVEALKRLRDEAKNYFGYMKIEAKSPNGWAPRGGVEDDYVALVVTLSMAQGRVNLISFLVDRMSTYAVNGPTVERLVKSAMLYVKEIFLFQEKAHQMFHAHYDKEGSDEEA